MIYSKFSGSEMHVHSKLPTGVGYLHQLVSMRWQLSRKPILGICYPGPRKLLFHLENINE